jgi:hypothetical protein
MIPRLAVRQYHSVTSSTPLGRHRPLSVHLLPFLRSCLDDLLEFLYGPRFAPTDIPHHRYSGRSMREVTWNSHALTVRVYGASGTTTVLEGMSKLTADTRFDRLQFIVVDFLDAEWSDTCFDGILDDLAAILIGSSYSNPNIRAAIVTNDPHIQRLVATLAERVGDAPPKLQLFSDRASAADWIAGQPRSSRPSMRFRPR